MVRKLSLLGGPLVIGIALGYFCCEHTFQIVNLEAHGGPGFTSGSAEDPFDFRNTDAYGQLAEDARFKLEAVNHDFILLWGALDKYAHDHGGQLPSSLENLVPHYILDLPRDPFAAERVVAPDEDTVHPSPEGALNYTYRPGRPGNGVWGNRAWIVRSIGLPDFPYRSDNGGGLSIVRGSWRRGGNMGPPQTKVYTRKRFDWPG